MLVDHPRAPPHPGREASPSLSGRWRPVRRLSKVAPIDPRRPGSPSRLRRLVRTQGRCTRAHERLACGHRPRSPEGLSRASRPQGRLLIPSRPAIEPPRPAPQQFRLPTEPRAQRSVRRNLRELRSSATPRHRLSASSQLDEIQGIGAMIAAHSSRISLPSSDSWVPLSGSPRVREEPVPGLRRL